MLLFSVGCSLLHLLAVSFCINFKIWIKIMSAGKAKRLLLSCFKSMCFDKTTNIPDDYTAMQISYRLFYYLIFYPHQSTCI
uniref:Putative ovule protein n=1 Tax=Solanum chacoense TaxID=4108 RepID=A0A0V0HZM1_SOLCH